MLHAACRKGYLEIVKRLINQKGNIHAQDEDNSTPLHYACENGSYEIVKLLLDLGANIDTNSDYGSPLQVACRVGHLEIVTLLCDRGASVNGIDSIRWRPLCVACKHGYLDVAEILLRHHADVNLLTNGWNALQVACQYGGFDIVSLLLDHEADPLTIDILHLIRNEHPNDCREIVKLLLKNAIEKIYIEDNIEHVAYRKSIAAGYSEIASFCKDDIDLLLLCAIITLQPIQEIERIIKAGASMYGSDKYRVMPIDLANKFHPDAANVEGEIIEKNELEISSHFSVFGDFSHLLWSPVEPTESIPDVEELEEESAGYDNANKNKRPLDRS